MQINIGPIWTHPSLVGAENSIDDSLLSCFWNHQTSETVFRKEYQEFCERCSSYFEAYTDGSKCEQKVAAGKFYPIRLLETPELFGYRTAALLLMLNYKVHSLT